MTHAESPLLTPRGGGGDALSAVEKEAKRVAMAFGVREAWKLIPYKTRMRTIEVFTYTSVMLYPKSRFVELIEVQFCKASNKLVCVDIGFPPSGPCIIWHPQCHLWVGSCSDANELMSHGLYKLGFEDESVLSQLPSLSAHERLELRLSLPREFWPVTWLEEVVK